MAAHRPGVALAMAIRFRSDLKHNGWELDHYAGGDRAFEYFPRRKEAEARWLEIQNLRRAGRAVHPSKFTFREFAERWIRDRQAGLIRGGRNRPYKPGSKAEAERTLEGVLYPALGGLRLAQVGREAAEDLDAALHARGLSLSSRRNAIAILSKVLDYAVHKRLAEFNPCAGLALIGGDAPPKRGAKAGAESPMSEAQAEAYIQKAMALYPPGGRGAAWGAALPLDVVTALRLGELLGLLWRNLTLTGPAPEVRVEQAWDTKAGTGFIPPKSEAARRAIPIRADVAKRLLEWKLSRKDRRDGDRVFPFGPSAALPRHKRVLKALEVPAFKLHGLRSVAASLWRYRGLPAPLVAYYMGHEDARTTDRHYTRLPAELLEQGRKLLTGPGAGTESQEEAK